MNSNELYQFYVTLSSFSNWPVFSAFFFSVARADRGGSSSFSYSLHSTNTYGPNTFQKIQVKTVLSGRAPLRWYVMSTKKVTISILLSSCKKTKKNCCLLTLELH